MTTVTSRLETGHGSAEAPPEPRRARPIVGWAALGVVFLAIEAAAFAGWIGSGQATRTPTGPDEVPTFMKVFIHGWEIGGLIVLPIFLYHFMIKPWRREGHITTDGLFCLVFFTIYWQDTILNFFQPWYAYNAEFWNLGAINTHILGWMSQNGNLQPEPILWAVPIYVYAVFGGMIIGCKMMRAIKAKRPQTTTFGLLAICYGVFVLVDWFAEQMWILMGFWTYPGAISWLTMFHGKWYQFPMYEPILVGFWMTALVSLRYFTNDKGESLGERGAERLGLTGWKKTSIRFLALAGAVNVGMLVYNVPGSIIGGLYADEWPKSIQERSYFMYGVCGEGTTYACPGPGIPIVRQPDSAHVSPEGKLVVPEGTKLPGQPD